MPSKANLSSEEVIATYLDATPIASFLQTPLPFSIPLQARFEHMHVVGGSGHGKTQLLQHLILHDLDQLKAGQGSIIVIDSQGDMLKNILSLRSVGEMADRLIIIDPNDIEYPPALNLFDFGLERLIHFNIVDREKLINGAIALYEYLFGALLGAELTQRQGVIFRFLSRLMMTVRGAVQPVNCLGRDAERGVEADGGVGERDVVVDGFRERDDIEASFNEAKGILADLRRAQAEAEIRCF